jgi:hypothetical protein
MLMAIIAIAISISATLVYAAISNTIQYSTTVHHVKISLTTTPPSSLLAGSSDNEKVTVSTSNSFSGALIVWMINSTGGTVLSNGGVTCTCVINPSSFTLRIDGLTIPTPTADANFLEFPGGALKPVSNGTTFNYTLTYLDNIADGTTYVTQVSVNG